jgi:type II secretory pathway pseudopilin PulG
MKKNYRKNSTRQGFLIIEMLVAISIVTVAILAAMEISQKGVSLSRRALHTSEAAFLLEEGAEATRILRDNAWSNISNLSTGTNYYPTYSGGTWTLSTTPTTVGIFNRVVTVSLVNRDGSSGDISEAGTNDSNTKLVTVTVSWDEAGVPITKTLQFYLMDIFS